MTRARGPGEKRSPAMEQFFRAKEQYPDALIFFRMGDFYELFHEDALVAAKALDLALTSRQKGSDGQDIPMAGVPHHAAAGYLARLVERGHRVAICEQMADPATVKGLVPREVVRVVTPGLALDAEALSERVDNWLVVVARDEEGVVLAGLDLGRAAARVAALADEVELIAELTRMEPRELLTTGLSAPTLAALPISFPRARIAAAPSEAPEALAEALAVTSSEALSDRERRCLSRALGYAGAAHPHASIRVEELDRGGTRATLGLDEPAIRNLELLRSLGGDAEGSLIHAIDATRTAMGARMLRRRLVRPLLDVGAIRRRLDGVERFVEDAHTRAALRAELDRVADLERLVTRAELALASPRELGAIRRSLASARAIADQLSDRGVHPLIDDGAGGAPELADALRSELERVLEDELPLVASQGGIVRAGADPRVDAARQLASSSRDVLVALEAREREASGIASLKIRFTRVFGHYIEITRANLKSTPAHFRRKQTVANAERYTTDELDELDHAIASAEERLGALELERFEALRLRVAAEARRLRAIASWLADLDVTSALAEVAAVHGYVRPEVDDSERLDLEGARHPVVERALPAGSFVPNDVHLDARGERLWIITGPNMAGKSTVMRQAALIVLLAQLGSYVPARKARVGVVDRIYTRIGASDNLARGQSTFMVEMAETAELLRGATGRSLVVLDEVGRGTSTYDGLAIARAVAEHLVDRVRCRALFATHYHELAALEAARPGAVRNQNAVAREHRGEVVFLHRIMPGSANRSYGVAVARLAGLPREVVERARAILDELERRPSSGEASAQLALFAAPTSAEDPRSAVLEELEAIDVSRTTPLEALARLDAWVARLRGSRDREG